MMASADPDPRTKTDQSETGRQNEGLLFALTALSAQLAGKDVDVRLDLAKDVQAPRPISELVCQVAAESLRNIVAHAGASNVTLTLRRVADIIELVVADDGRGFNPRDPGNGPADGHLGLALLRDRVVRAGGELTLDSSAGGGTTVRLFVPIEDSA
ncbi:MAG: two-component system, NarL family, sensor kinase [Frankiaceae bacterium]|jgi:two-component system NarL family sensor kinase|nr:two-component system, NarL family, sensor kinase [Frankiaceae bacterium]MDQ1635778.1 two-component system, NarL family, sensor kinase [Frankiaceae bacterium]MDQ1650418.1 two-component system, NarL family, sensor kinase [Frankiaceae bacterium]